MAELIVALDYGCANDALKIAQDLAGQVNWFKIGLELFISAGPEIVRELQARNQRIFLDLKLYDIPNTVVNAALAATRLGVDMLTVHCQGGEAMCAGLAKALSASFAKPPLVIGVTALTSFRDNEMPGIDMPVGEYGSRLANLAQEWGLNGVVCSPLEARKIKRATNLICVCPGIRPQGAEADDQGRISTPKGAVEAGADYLVVGRPITRSRNPLSAAAQILAEMAEASASKGQK